MSLNGKYGFLSEQDKIFPPMVVLKITTACNLECIHCPHSFISKQKDYSPRHMEWDIYDKIVTEVSSHRGTIFRLLSDGEPLLHPDFLNMLRLAKSKNVSPVNFITNGMLLNAELAEAILSVGVEAVEISLDALNKETYERIRRGSDYKLVMLNVHRFIELRNKMKAKTKIMVSIIDQPESGSEKEDFIKYWTDKVDKVITRIYTSVGGLVDDTKLKIDCSTGRWPCAQLWRRIFINVDGFAEFCVEDWHDESIMGNVKNSNIRDIWRSPQYEKIRELHLANKFDEVTYCSRCKDWKARGWDYDYFHALNQVLGG